MHFGARANIRPFCERLRHRFRNSSRCSRAGGPLPRSTRHLRRPARPSKLRFGGGEPAWRSLWRWVTCRANSASSEATRYLSDFADAAIETALATALTERVPGAEVRGITVIALGKLGSRELNYSSDVDLLLLFDPETLPRRERDDPSEAAVRDRPPDHRASAEADRGRLCRPRRPAASAVARSHADRPPGQCGHFPLRILGAAVGTRRLHPRPGLRRRSRARRAFPRVDPAVRLAALARFRGDRGSPGDLRAHPRPFRAGRAGSARATT